MLPIVHVARPPLTHVFCPIVQLSVHVSEHWAFGAVPEHDCGAAHLAVDETTGQPSASMPHVATVRPSWHTVPARVQMAAAQLQLALPADTVHDCCAPHVLVVTQAVQPFDCKTQVCTAPAAHWVAPAVQALVQHAALPAAPVHAPPVQGVFDEATLHPSASCEQMANVVALAQVGPAAVQSASSLHVHLADPAAPVQP